MFLLSNPFPPVLKFCGHVRTLHHLRHHTAAGSTSLRNSGQPFRCNAADRIDRNRNTTANIPEKVQPSRRQIRLAGSCKNVSCNQPACPQFFRKHRFFRTVYRSPDCRKPCSLGFGKSTQNRHGQLYRQLQCSDDFPETVQPQRRMICLTNRQTLFGKCCIFRNGQIFFP